MASTKSAVAMASLTAFALAASTAAMAAAEAAAEEGTTQNLRSRVPSRAQATAAEEDAGKTSAQILVVDDADRQVADDGSDDDFGTPLQAWRRERRRQRERERRDQQQHTDQRQAEEIALEKKIMGGERLDDSAEWSERMNWFVSLRGCEDDDCCDGDISDDCWIGCAGSLVSSRHVLTAAHCCTDLDDFVLTRVRAGAKCKYDDNCNHDYESSRIADVELHPGYRTVPGGSMPEYDICLLTLETPITSIAPVSIDLGDVLDSTDDYEDLTAAGFGKYRNTGLFKYPNYLMHVDLAKLPDELCEDEYPKNFKKECMFCAGVYETRSTCSGDSGGPLVVNRRTETYNGDDNGNDDGEEPCLVGVTSWGKSACKGGPGSASVFAGVADVVPWFGPKTCNGFDFEDERPNFCRPCHRTYEGQRPEWCDEVDDLDETGANRGPSATTAAPEGFSTTNTTSTNATSANTTSTNTTVDAGSPGNQGGNSDNNRNNNQGGQQNPQTSTTPTASSVQTTQVPPSTTTASASTTDPTAAAGAGVQNQDTDRAARCAEEMKPDRKYCNRRSSDPMFCTCKWLAAKRPSKRSNICNKDQVAYKMCMNTCVGDCSY